MRNRIKQQIKESADLKLRMLDSEALLADIEKASEMIVSALKSGNKLLLAGNGGSAADAQHIAAEFINRFKFDRPALPAIALTTDTSVITSIANDYNFNSIFARQAEAIGNKGDIFIAISTSGSSANLVEGLRTARDKGILTIGLAGSTGGSIRELCDICIMVPSSDTPRIQEAHTLIEHIICALVEEELFSGR